MKQREWKLGSWDALVKKTTNSLQIPIFRKIDQRYPQGNCLTHTTAAKLYILSTWYPWDEPSAHSKKAPA